MTKRCIMIFPKFENLNVIEDMRKKYDSHYGLVDPHITLVFPFESDLSARELKLLLENALEGFKPFRLRLSGISAQTEGYLFLDVVEGQAQLIEMHKRLYWGPLRHYYPDFLNHTKFLPHMTIGRLDDEAGLNKAAAELSELRETFEDLVQTVTVEIIDEDEKSIIEMTYFLSK